MEKCTECGKEIIKHSPFVGVCYDCYARGEEDTQPQQKEVFYTKIPDDEPKIERIGEMKLIIKQNADKFEMTANDRLAAYIEKMDPKKVIEFLLNAVR